MVETQSLIMLTAVVDTGSFTKAAEQLNMVPSNISKRIGALEEQFGTRLFYRTTRKLSLTGAGELYVQQARHILGLMQKAEQDMVNLQSRPSGKLVIEAPQEWGQDYLTPAIAQFLNQFPDVEVQLNLSDKLSDFIESGTDVFFRDRNLVDANVVTKPVMNYQFGLFASHRYIQAFGEPQTLDDLTSHKFLVYHSKSMKLDTLEFRGKDQPDWQTVVLNGRFFTNSGTAVTKALYQGIGIGIETLDDNNGALAKQCRQILPDFEVRVPGNYGQTIWLVWPNREHLATKVRAFIDFISGYFEDKTAK